MTRLAHRARAFNRAAYFLAPDPEDHDTIPVVVLAGFRIGAYLTDDGCLFIGCDAEEAEAGGDRMPVVIRVDRRSGPVETIIPA